ncbi:MAG: alkaline phosphatase family protein [Candidatus Eisenbacteria bacterium]
MSRPPLMVVVLVDALGWERVGETPFLEGELPHRKPLDTVLGFSAGAIPALLSGTWPAENGHWVMFHRDPARSPFGLARWMALLPGRARRSWRLRQWVKARAKARVRGYFDLYEVPWRVLRDLDVCERDPLFATGALPGIGTIFDDMAAQRLQVRTWDWRTDDDANERAFVAAAEAAGHDDGEAPDVLFYYTAAIDARMHAGGTKAPAVADRLARLEGALTRALAAARAGGREAWCYLTSDHGMTDVVEHVDVMARVEASGLTPGVDYHAFYDSTMARFWFHGPLAADRVRRALEGLPGRFLTREDEDRLGIHFPDRRYGDAIYLLEDARLLVPSYMGSAPVAAMHGYDPATPGSQALLLSNRELPQDLAHVVDFRAFFGSELGARRAGLTRHAASGGAR